MDEGMRNLGVQDASVYKSLGLFAVTAIGLIALLIVYAMARMSKGRTGVVHRVRRRLERKLFYSSFLRYMIVSNLKLNFTLWAFLASTWSFDTK